MTRASSAARVEERLLSSVLFPLPEAPSTPTRLPRRIDAPSWRTATQVCESEWAAGSVSTGSCAGYPNAAATIGRDSSQRWRRRRREGRSVTRSMWKRTHSDGSGGGLWTIATDTAWAACGGDECSAAGLVAGCTSAFRCCCCRQQHAARSRRVTLTMSACAWRHAQ